MADKNAKAELNVEDLEGVAGGASVNVPNDPNDIRNHGINVLDSMKPTLDVRRGEGEKNPHPQPTELDLGQKGLPVGGVNDRRLK